MRSGPDKGLAWLPSTSACAAGVGAVAAVVVVLQVLASPYIEAFSPGDHDAGSSVAGSQGWKTVVSETFEGGIGPRWIVTGTGVGAGDGYVWGTSTYTYVSGERSVWCAGGAEDAGGSYTDGMSSWLVSEPIELGGSDRDRTWGAEVEFAWWLETSSRTPAVAPLECGVSMRQLSSLPSSGDWFGWSVITGASDLRGGQWTYVSGSSSGWVRGWLSLDRFLPTGGVTRSVRVAFHFVSDDDGRVGRGAYVDDVKVRVNRGYDTALPLVLLEPTPTPRPTPSPAPTSGLRNASFEQGWYDIAIGQAPNEWTWHWADGEIVWGSDGPVFAPESRVLPKYLLPPEERDLFVLDGSHCVKIFKSYAPIYGALSQQVTGLEPGRQYRLTVPVYVDVFSWEGGKVAPTDPSAARVRLGASLPTATWRDEGAISYGPWRDGRDVDGFYLAYNDYVLEFTAVEEEMRVYVEVFAKWRLPNNGFFIDDLELEAIP